MTMWMDANAPYHDRFVNKRASDTAYDVATDQALARQIAVVHERRCSGCHSPAEVSRLDWIDLRRPDDTLFLRAPLSKSAGGSGKCGGPVYQDDQDADYQAVRTAVRNAADQAFAHPRRDLQALAR